MIKKFIGPAIAGAVVFYLAWGLLASWLGDGAVSIAFAALSGLVIAGLGTWVLLRDHDVPDVVLPVTTGGSPIVPKTAWILVNLIGAIAAFVAWGLSDFALAVRPLLIALGAGAAAWLVFLVGVYAAIIGARSRCTPPWPN
jgi:hypothetical protein